MPEPASIRALAEEDLDFASLLHASALSHGFFARLGQPFGKAYLRAYIASPFAVGLVAVQGGARTGILVGTRLNRAHLAWTVRNHGLRLGVLGLLALAGQPPLAVRFLRTRTGRYVSGVRRLLRRPVRTAAGRQGCAAPGASPSQPDAAVLSHVAVVPASRGLGVGRALVDAFMLEVGAQEVRLITLAGGSGAGGFYRRLGWRFVASRTNLDGEWVSEYVHAGRDLPEAQRPG